MSLTGLTTTYTPNKVNETALDRREAVLNNLNPNREQTQRTIGAPAMPPAGRLAFGGSATNRPYVIPSPGAHKNGSLNTAIQSALNKPAQQVQPTISADGYSARPMFVVAKNQNPASLFGL